MSSNLVIDEYGDKRWYNKKEQLHRLDGPAFECTDGYKSWWINGELHRLDGPATECSSGRKIWYVDGKRHRLDGPAVEYADGCKEWYINGIQYTEKEYLNKINELQVEVVSKPKVSRFRRLEIK